MEPLTDTREHIIDSFKDSAKEIETYLHRIDRGDIDDLNGILRCIRSVKSDAAMLNLTSLVDFTHSLEEVLASIRAKLLAPSKMMFDVLELGFDRLRDLHYRELLDQEFGELHEMELQVLFAELAIANGAEVEEKCHQIIELLGAGFVHTKEPAAKEDNGKLEQALPADTPALDTTAPITCFTKDADDPKEAFDLRFFRELALQVDRQSQYWEGRSDQLVDWAQRMNNLLGQPVNPSQLSAAIYLHDIGMSFLPNHIITKEGELSSSELEEMQQHPIWGYNYLTRVQGWDEAATIILEHHERIDGKGYPYGNSGKIIHDGAKILAIIDAFFSITNGRADRIQRRSLIRAVSDINARVDTQFDPNWVNAFNDMIRIELRKGSV